MHHPSEGRGHSRKRGEHSGGGRCPTLPGGCGRSSASSAPPAAPRRSGRSLPDRSLRDRWPRAGARARAKLQEWKAQRRGCVSASWRRPRCWGSLSRSAFGREEGEAGYHSCALGFQSKEKAMQSRRVPPPTTTIITKYRGPGTRWRAKPCSHRRRAWRGPAIGLWGVGRGRWAAPVGQSCSDPLAHGPLEPRLPPPPPPPGCSPNSRWPSRQRTRGQVAAGEASEFSSQPHPHTAEPLPCGPGF